MMLGVSERCEGTTRDGARCRSIAVKGRRFCPHHLSVADEAGEESVGRGDHDQRRRRDSALVRVVREPSSGTGSKPSRALVKTGNVAVASAAEVRPRLGELVAANLDELEAVLLDVALSASRPVWVTTRCKSCNRDGRHQVVIGDHRVQLEAITKLLEQAVGRPATAEQPVVAALPRRAADVKKLSWGELQQLFAASFVTELADMHRAGSGEAVLQERVSRLTDHEREVLRRALDPG
jgi:hypothetical protein